MPHRLLGLVAAAVVLSGGAQIAAPPASGAPVPAASQPLVDLRIGGGFVPVGASFRELPVVYVTADRRVVTQGPQIAIFPPPALPNLIQRQLTPRGWDRIVKAARDNGMLAKADYGRIANIADAPTARLAIRVGSKVYRHEAYGLQELDGGPDDGLTAPQRAARARMKRFVAALQDIETTVGPGSLGPERPLPLPIFRVQARPAVPDGQGAAPDGPDLIEREVRPWPVPTVGLADASSCRAVTGAAATSLRQALTRANSETRFTDKGVIYDVAVRPVLPGEPNCP